MTERVTYINGRIVPDSDALISFRDSMAMNGEGVYDTERTFDGQVFKLREHLDRLARSLEYLRIEPPIAFDELEEITLEIARRNYEIVGEDLWVSQRISRGTPLEWGGSGQPTVIVECLPIPFAERALYYVEGADVATPTLRRTPPWAQSPQAKTMSLLNLRLGALEAQASSPGVWPILVDENGNLAEGAASNIFVVRSGRLLTPQKQYVLAGVTRNTVLELAEADGIPTAECDIGLYEAYMADEIFITSTSLCICPARTLNGARPRAADVPGPITKQLQDAFAELVGVDFVAQYLAHLTEPVPV